MCERLLPILPDPPSETESHTTIVILHFSDSRIAETCGFRESFYHEFAAVGSTMKKVQTQSSPRSLPSRSRPSSSSNSNRKSNDDDPSLNMRTLDDTLPRPASTSRSSGPPPKVANPRRASLDQQALPKVPTTSRRRASLDQKSVRKPSNVHSSTVISLGKQSLKKDESSRLRKVPTEVKKEDDSIAATLPLDSLCLCLQNLQSVYHVVTCASVNRHWREAVRSDAVWKALYERWWHEEDENGAISQTMRLPPGFGTWKETFISEYSEGKRKIQSEVITHSVNAGWLHIRRMLDRRGKRVRDCTPGDSMRKLVEHLGLTFHVQINRDTPIRLRGRASVVYYPGSCLLRYPTKSTKSCISLRALKSFKITATSDRLLRTCTVASFDVQNGQWEMVSREGQNPGPLRLLQHSPNPSKSWMVGTLFEGMHGIDGFSMDEHGEEQVLLLMASLHLSDLLWIMMELGEGATPQSSRSVYHDHMNPSYGLYNWHASIQLHTFGKHLWGQEFHQVFWSPRESTPGQTAVFLLISSHEVFPGILTTPWRTEVFSGELRGVFMLDFTLWDPGMEIAWHCTRAVRTYPAELATVEYGPPGLDGERVHTGVQDEKEGVSVSMNLCTPFANGGWGATPELDDSVVVITDLRFALTPKFLLSWFGRFNF